MMTTARLETWVRRVDVDAAREVKSVVVDHDECGRGGRGEVRGLRWVGWAAS